MTFCVPQCSPQAHTLRKARRQRGFTIVELMVTATIFVVMTALVVAKYGTFNQSVLLTNLVYDVALTVRTAQTYGLSVQGIKPASTLVFNAAYGVHFDTTANTQMVLFADTNQGTALPGEHLYEAGLDTIVNTYSIKYGGKITSLCLYSNASTCTTKSTVDISFTRPDPSAVICVGSNDCTYSAAQITITGPGTAQTRSVTIRQNGQISVDN